MRQTLLIGLIAATVSVPALAGHEDAYEDRGRVTAVTPQFERVNTPRQECRTEYVRESYYEAPRRSNTGAIIGGVAGGLVGSRFGGGNGRIATAALGAGLGAVIGDRYDNNGRDSQGRERVVTRPVESCVTVDNWHQVPAGYLVSYEYNGRQYSTVTDQDPGRYIPVHVEVRPNGYVTNVVYRPAVVHQPARFNDNRGPGHKNGHGKNQNRRYW
jgi:uncharacterized protein YcfJ